jgi:predicted transcriptional regulator
MKKKTSVSLSEEILALADSIATASERSRSWIIEKAINLGLPALDSQEARKLRSERPKKK